MQFETVLGSFIRFFEQEGIRYAVIGGLALQAYGYSRFTRDADFVVERSAQDRLLEHARTLGYETLHVSEGYSNHLHPAPNGGRVDFMYVDERTGEKLFGAAESKQIVGSITAPVPRAEHLAAMKAMSMKNSPERVLIDSPDVQFILSLPGVNRAEIRDYFARHGLLELFDAIEKRS